jgi:RNA polymerase sigma factor (sigma-70 family)
MMLTPPPNSPNGYLRQVLCSWQQDDRSDAELLTVFFQSQDEQVFANLIHRYGVMVWGVCRRILSHLQDAEDAFQATFLVLARRAGQLRHKKVLGPWLYGVALRTAWKVRRSVVPRPQQEKLKLILPPTASSEEGQADLLNVLNEEVQQLPEYYRVPLILCRFEGRTYAEAARMLGCSRAGIYRCIARAEELLRERLTRRGVFLTDDLYGRLSEPDPDSNQDVRAPARRDRAGGPGLRL